MVKLLTLEQGSQEWHDWRKSRITASELPIILGHSPYCTPYLLWQRKLGFAPPQADNLAMKRGRELESLVRHKVNAERFERGDAKAFVPACVEHDELAWAGASLDGYSAEDSELLEIKCPGLQDHQDAEMGKVPPKYRAQIQWQLFVTGAECAVYVSYYNEELAYVLVSPDEDYISGTLLPAAGEFKRLLEEMVEPERSEDDFVEMISDEWQQYAREWSAAREMLTLYQDKEKHFKQALVSLTDDSNCRGFGVALRRVQREGSVDYKKLYEDIKEAYPDVADAYPPDNYRKEQVGYWKVSSY